MPGQHPGGDLLPGPPVRRNPGAGAPAGRRRGGGLRPRTSISYSPFYLSGWQDSPATTTPIVAAALNNMESGIAAATNQANAALAAAGSGGGGGGSVPGMQVIYMDALGADNTGGTSVTSLFNAQLTAAAGKPCLIVFGIGNYKWTTAPNSLTTGQSVHGLGKSVTSFTWSGAGPLFTVTEPAVSGTWDGSDDAGQFSGFSFIGPFGSGGTAGIKYGALQGIRLDDIGFFGLDGPCVQGVEVTAGVDWAEEAIMTRLDISGCGATSKKIFDFSGTSFDYTLIDGVVVVEANIDIVALSGGALMQGLELGLRGNLHGGASNTGAIISVDRGNTAGTSLVGGGVFRVTMEGDDSSAGGSGTVGHYLVYMGSSNAASQFSAQGVMSVYDAGAPTQGIFNPNSLPVSFSGFMSPCLQGEAQVVYGGQALTDVGMGFDTLFDNTIFLEFADVMAFQLAAGANAIAIDQASSWVRRLTFLIKQPSSGGSGTITWPSSFVFPGGTKPTLSTTANYIDMVEAVWDPVTAKYYAHLVGTHFA